MPKGKKKQEPVVHDMRKGEAASLVISLSIPDRAALICALVSGYIARGVDYDKLGAVPAEADHLLARWEGK